MTAPPERWQDLFAGGTDPRDAIVRWRVVRRGDEPFLYLPEKRHVAAQVLELYPAQTLKAVLARDGLALALRWGISPLKEWTDCRISAQHPFAAFLTQMAGTRGLPQFGILAGNPRAPGRRYVLPLFNETGHPQTVVKAGVSLAAQRLIQGEADFLIAVSPMMPGLPRVWGVHETANVRAFAMQYFAGHSPEPNDTKPLQELLNAWLKADCEAELSEFRMWQRLKAAGPLPPFIQSLATVRVHPALSHGDLAPWNVRVAEDGKWTVIDWERGEWNGIPAWDWFHYILQPALLVRREPAEQLLARVERLLSAPDFSNYAHRAGLQGHERALFLAYLAYCLRVIRQTEGGNRLTELEALATTRWFPHAG